MKNELVYAVNEEGVYMQDMVMCLMMGVNKLPDGYEVGFMDGNTLNCTEKNLVLAKKGEGRNAHS